MIRSSRNVNMEVLDFIEEEDQVALNSEEKVFDEHVNRVTYIIERLEKLEDLVTTEPVTHHASTQWRCSTRC